MTNNTNESGWLDCGCESEKDHQFLVSEYGTCDLDSIIETTPEED